MNKADHTMVLHLDLRRCGIYLHSIRLLSEGLKGCTGLVHLDLRANPFVNAESVEEGEGHEGGLGKKVTGRGAGPRGKGAGEEAGIDATEARAAQLFDKANYKSSNDKTEPPSAEKGDRNRALFLLWDALVHRGRGMGIESTEGEVAPSGEGSLMHLNGLDAGTSFDIDWKRLRTTLSERSRREQDGEAKAGGAGADEREAEAGQVGEEVGLEGGGQGRHGIAGPTTIAEEPENADQDDDAEASGDAMQAAPSTGEGEGEARQEGENKRAGGSDPAANDGRPDSANNSDVSSDEEDQIVQEEEASKHKTSHWDKLRGIGGTVGNIGVDVSRRRRGEGDGQDYVEVNEAT